MFIDNRNSLDSFFSFVENNKTPISVFTALYSLPLFTTNNFSPLRSLLAQITLLLIFGMFTLSFELQLARTGLLNFGQAVFFGIGAYTLAFYIDFITNFQLTTVLKIGPLVLPPPLLFDFLKDPIFVLIIGLVIAVLLSAVLGFLEGLTTNRMRGTTFAFIALAIAMLFFSYATSNSQGIDLSGGETGRKVLIFDLFKSLPFYLFFAVLISFIMLILFVSVIYTDLKKRRGILGISLFESPLNSEESEFFQTTLDSRRIQVKSVIFIGLIVIIVSILFFQILPNIGGMSNITESDSFLLTIPINYYLVLSLTCITYFYSKKLIHSPFGRVLAGISQNEQRTQALGYNVYRYKIKSLAISGGIAGLAGALFASTVRNLTPETTFSVENTINVMIFSIVGGLNTLLGPFLGSAFVMTAESSKDTNTGIFASILNQLNISADMITIFIGLIYIIIVLVLPFGVVGTIQVRGVKISERLRKIGINPSEYWIIAFFAIIAPIIVFLNFKDANSLLTILGISGVVVVLLIVLYLLNKRKKN